MATTAPRSHPTSRMCVSVWRAAGLSLWKTRHAIYRSHLRNNLREELFRLTDDDDTADSGSTEQARRDVVFYYDPFFREGL